MLLPLFRWHCAGNWKQSKRRRRRLSIQYFARYYTFMYVPLCLCTWRVESIRVGKIRIRCRWRPLSVFKMCVFTK